MGCPWSVLSTAPTISPTISHRHKATHNTQAHTSSAPEDSQSIPEPPKHAPTSVSAIWPGLYQDLLTNTYLGYSHLAEAPSLCSMPRHPSLYWHQLQPPHKGVPCTEYPRTPRASSAQRAPGPPWAAPTTASYILKGFLWEIALGLPRLHPLRLQICCQDTLHRGHRTAQTCSKWLQLSNQERSVWRAQRPPQPTAMSAPAITSCRP